MYPPYLFQKELAVACQAALQAGRAILRLHSPPATGDDVNADDTGRTSERLILALIQSAFPDDALLSQSSKDSPDRLQAARVWIVDPLDGVLEFGTCNGEFSVMIALLQDGVLQVGVVYRPVSDVLYYAVAGAGAYRSNGHGPERLQCMPSRNGTHVVGTQSPADPVVLQLCREDGFTDVEAGSSIGSQCARIAEGTSDLYVQPVATLAEWDTAAPELIVSEAGGCVTDCFGRALSYNKEVPLQSTGIIAAHPAITFRIIPTLARVMDGKRPSQKWRFNGK